MANTRQIRRVIEAVKSAGGRLGAAQCGELQLRKDAVEQAIAHGLVDFDELTEDLVWPPTSRGAGYDPT